MAGRLITKALVGTLLLAAPVAGLAQWIPGSEITGQSIQIETNGVTNTVFFDPGGVARIQTPGDRFYRGHANAQTGSGLGLSIVRNIAEQHGARIDLDTSRYGGLKASVVFPR